IQRIFAWAVPPLLSKFFAALRMSKPWDMLIRRVRKLCSQTPSTRRASILHRANLSSVANVGHERLHILLLLSGQRQEWQARTASVVAIQIAGKLQAGHTHLCCDADRGLANALLFFFRQPRVPFLPRRPDLIAALGRTRGKRENGAVGPRRQRSVQGAGGPCQDGEPHFFLARLDPRRRSSYRECGIALTQYVDGDEILRGGFGLR